MAVSVHLAVSFGVLLLAGLCFVTSQVTDVWMECGGDLTFGVWKFCTLNKPVLTWECVINFSGFNMAAQTFSILAILCYVSALLLYTVATICPSLNKSRPITTGLCSLAFFIVSLQIMTMIVIGVKVQQHLNDITRVGLQGGRVRGMSETAATLRLSWSFTAAIVSTMLATITGVAISIELRNITIDGFQ